MIKNIKHAVLWTNATNNINGEELFGSFYQNELQETNQKQFRIEKVIKRILSRV